MPAVIERLTAEHGTVPPPWVVCDEHPFSIGWRMGGGESHLMLWRDWWRRQDFDEGRKIDYFRRWPPPHCWLAFLIEAVWGVDLSEAETFEEPEFAPYFDRTAALGFGGRKDFLRDLDDPKWLET